MTSSRTDETPPSPTDDRLRAAAREVVARILALAREGYEDDRGIGCSHGSPENRAEALLRALLRFAEAAPAPEVPAALPAKASAETGESHRHREAAEDAVARAVADAERRAAGAAYEKAAAICELHATGYVDTAAVHRELMDTARDIRTEIEHGPR